MATSLLTYVPVGFLRGLFFHLVVLLVKHKHLCSHAKKTSSNRHGSGGCHIAADLRGSYGHCCPLDTNVQGVVGDGPQFLNNKNPLDELVDHNFASDVPPPILL